MKDTEFLTRLREQGLLRPLPRATEHSADAPLEAGQLRRLDPLPGYPGPSHSNLVLVCTTPEEDDLPDDITNSPGPCWITHVMLVDSPHNYATTRDLTPSREATGTPFELAVIVDSFCTIRLPHDDRNGATRFGPWIGNPLPREVTALGWVAPHLTTPDLHAEMDGTPFEGAFGCVEAQTGDNLWYSRCRDIRNLNTLTGW